jgi:hypothetical protein
MVADTEHLILGIVTVALIYGPCPAQSKPPRVARSVPPICRGTAMPPRHEARVRERAEDDQSTRPRPPRCKRFVRRQHG